MAIRVAPITDADVRAVAEFLHRELNGRVPADAWARSLDVPWKVAAPNHGFMLVDPADADAVTRVKGVNLAFYSERVIDGGPERFCNLGAWCVLPDFRFYGVRLLKALLAQDGYTFTDLSPSGTVPQINERLGLSYLDTTTALVPNLPWPTLARATADPAVIERTLSGTDLEVYLDHRDAAAARHVLLRVGGAACHVVFRKDRRKGLPLFASVLHVSDPAVFRRGFRAFSRHLLLRHGIPATLLEERVAGFRPAGSRQLANPRRKMFRSSRLTADQIDYLYSELVSVAW
jgi:hypothetical protein